MSIKALVIVVILDRTLKLLEVELLCSIYLISKLTSVQLKAELKKSHFKIGRVTDPVFILV